MNSPIPIYQREKFKRDREIPSSSTVGSCVVREIAIAILYGSTGKFVNSVLVAKKV